MYIIIIIIVYMYKPDWKWHAYITFVIVYDYPALSQDSKLSYLCYRVVYLCVAHLFTMIMKAENIDINSKKK